MIGILYGFSIQGGISREEYARVGAHTFVSYLTKKAMNGNN